jgi:hypothetical protein
MRKKKELPIIQVNDTKSLLELQAQEDRQIEKVQEMLKKQFLAAFKAAYGNVDEVCTAIGIRRRHYMKWLEEDAEFQMQVFEAQESVGDFVEGKLLNKIQKGDTLATIFYAKTKLKKRGYSERNDGDGGKPAIAIQVNIQGSNIDVEERSKLK